MYERRFWIIEVNAKSPTFVYNNFTEEEVDKLWAEAVHMYKENPNMELYLGEEYINMAKNDQIDYKAFNNDDDVEFLKNELFEREFIFDVNGPTYKGNYMFRDYDDFYKQMKEENVPDVDGITLTKSKINIVKGQWIKKFLFDEYRISKSHKYISFAVGWDFKGLYIKNKFTNYYIRREP